MTFWSRTSPTFSITISPAEVEKQFDEIADGNLQWVTMIDDFYKPFHKTTVHTTEHSERAKGERVLGVDPESGKPLSVRIGRFGPMAQIGEVEDEEKPKFASFLKDQRIDTITLEEALQLFSYPKTVGQYEGEDVVPAGAFRAIREIRIHVCLAS